MEVSHTNRPVRSHDRDDTSLSRFFVTCGNDGDVRIWEGLDDDDPKFITVGEKVYSLAVKVGHRRLILYHFIHVLGMKHGVGQCWSEMFSSLHRTTSW